MELINRMRKNRKGFTLVEIIVVLVILAILAAFTIPTMLGFVNDARGKALITEAREVKLAAQATATEYVGKGTAVTADELGSAALVMPASGATDSATSATKQMRIYLTKDITPLATNPATTSPSNGSFWTIQLGTSTNGAQVTGITYVKDGYTVTLNTSGSTVVKN
ncbi:type II secretion system protein [Acetobacterium wieringae]|uniref:Type II secretion system protein G n=1 Tax=Acetobacterium wieringae TaxID=52694 RepID=A0A1F2PFS9_9FIRM|nr:prepilin-type N-terminal cleavage/methylation domain-containing protein [Acetobacterium wieringae]OFV70163.1 type II secretion system protein G precursor [Acetobacterium wieringae]